MRISEIRETPASIRSNERYAQYLAKAKTQIATQPFSNKTRKTECLQTLGYAYEYLRNVVHDDVLATARETWSGNPTEEEWAVRNEFINQGDLPYNLSSLREKHFTPFLLSTYADQVVQFRELLALYAEVKASEVNTAPKLTGIEKTKAALASADSSFDATAFDKLFKEITTAFESVDATFIAKQGDWAVGRVEAMLKFRAENPSPLNNDDYARLKSVAGGETWFALFNRITPEQGRGIGEQSGKATVEARNTAIAVKLTKEKVTKINDADVVYGNGGFTGMYRVATENGPKRVKISVIVAGGYNIQCLHMRTLVKVI